MSAVYPIILAGGSGTRLWPLSRTHYPKQFLRIQGETSLLQQTVQRVIGIPDIQKPIIITNEKHYFLSQEQLTDLADVSYLLEPEGKNTAPSIASCAHYLMERFGPDTVMLVLPADHWVGDVSLWQNALHQGVEWVVKNNKLLTFGIKPTEPNINYGYIEINTPEQNIISAVSSFHEKPDKATAQKMMASGHFFWNSGMFIMPVGLLLKELIQWAPDIEACTKEAIDQATQANDYVRLNQAIFAQCRSESIDYALMEKTQQAAMMPLDIPWSDLGSWDAVAQAVPMNAEGNSVVGHALLQDTKDCFIHSEAPLVATLGIKNQIIIATQDVILVADKSQAAQVKTLVQALSQEHHMLAHEHQRVARPWGYFEILAEGPTFKVKRLMLKPRAKISLQMHQHRAEHWVVVSGIADIINGEQVMCLRANQSTYIPPKTRHRLGNSEKEPLCIIEVQSGDYLGEDDIVRYDDVYEREKIGI